MASGHEGPFWGDGIITRYVQWLNNVKTLNYILKIGLFFMNYTSGELTKNNI